MRTQNFGVSLSEVEVLKLALSVLREQIYAQERASGARGVPVSLTASTAVIDDLTSRLDHAGTRVRLAQKKEETLAASDIPF